MAPGLLRHRGANEIEDEPSPSALVLLIRQFRSPLIYILVVAALITMLLEDYFDAGVIAAALAINAVIGFTQERWAENSVRALMGMVAPHARVPRDGIDRAIESRDVVPGDLILLESGARPPTCCYVRR